MFVRELTNTGTVAFPVPMLMIFHCLAFAGSWHADFGRDLQQAAIEPGAQVRFSSAQARSGLSATGPKAELHKRFFSGH